MKNIYKLLAIATCVFTLHTAKAQSEATFYTSMGDFKVDLTDTLTPITVDSFIARVASKFYDGIIFHRVIDGFMIQGGDPLGNGTGGPGYAIPDEFHATLSNVQKTISMANSGPNTGGSQFFINLVNNTGLDYDKNPPTSKHAVFGIVTTGFNIVQAIGKVATKGGTGSDKDKPVTDVVMDSVRITRFPASVAQYYSATNKLNIYPNPTNNIFNIDLPGINTEVSIIDVSGKAIMNTSTKEARITIDMTDNPSGIYLVRISNDNGSAYGRVIVQ